MKYVPIIAGLALLACAQRPDKMGATEVSPLVYKDYDCDQIIMESDRISTRVNKLYQQLNDEARADEWQMGIGLVLFWPALFFLEGGDGPEAVEFRELKGQYNALRKAEVMKKCGLKMGEIEDLLPKPQNAPAPKIEKYQESY